MVLSLDIIIAILEVRRSSSLKFPHKHKHTLLLFILQMCL